jgi:hypothetical protein
MINKTKGGVIPTITPPNILNICSKDINISSINQLSIDQLYKINSTIEKSLIKRYVVEGWLCNGTTTPKPYTYTDVQTINNLFPQYNSKGQKVYGLKSDSNIIYPCYNNLFSNTVTIDVDGVDTYNIPPIAKLIDINYKYLYIKTKEGQGHITGCHLILWIPKGVLISTQHIKIDKDSGVDIMGNISNQLIYQKPTKSNLYGQSYENFDSGIFDQMELPPNDMLTITPEFINELNDYILQMGCNGKFKYTSHHTSTSHTSHHTSTSHTTNGEILNIVNLYNKDNSLKHSYHTTTWITSALYSVCPPENVESYYSYKILESNIPKDAYNYEYEMNILKSYKSDNYSNVNVMWIDRYISEYKDTIMDKLNGNCLIISPTGTGKSEFIKELSNHKDVFVVTPRKLITNDYEDGGVPSMCYQNPNIKSMLRQHKYVVIDEQHLLSEFNGINKGNYDNLIKILYECEDVNIIQISATPNFNIAEEVFNHKPYKIIQFKLREEGKRVVDSLIYVHKDAQIKSELINSCTLTSHKLYNCNHFIYCNNKTVLNEYHSLLNQAGIKVFNYYTQPNREEDVINTQDYIKYIKEWETSPNSVILTTCKSGVGLSLKPQVECVVWLLDIQNDGIEGVTQAANRVRCNVKSIVVRGEKMNSSERLWFVNEWVRVFNGINYKIDYSVNSIKIKGKLYYEACNLNGNARLRYLSDYIILAGLKDSYNINRCYYSFKSLNEMYLRYGNYTLVKVLNTICSPCKSENPFGTPINQSFNINFEGVEMYYNGSSFKIIKPLCDVYEGIKRGGITNKRLRDYKTKVFTLFKLIYGSDIKHHQLATYEIFGYKIGDDGELIIPKDIDFNTNNQWVIHYYEDGEVWCDYVGGASLWECGDGKVYDKVSLSKRYKIKLNNHFNRVANRKGCKCKGAILRGV